MARSVSWTESAVDSLLNAAAYIAKDSPTYAAALVDGAERAAESLVALPDRGRRVPEYRDPTIRELFVGSYRLIYSVDDATIVIIAFVHGSRDLEALLRRTKDDLPS